MIYGDISEVKRTHDAFFSRLDDNYGIKELGTWDCNLRNILLKCGDKEYCTSERDIPILLDSGKFSLSIDKTKCSDCPNRAYIRFADFEIAPARAFYERKTAADFLASRRSRLYHQLNLMDTFVEGRKGLILEGMPRKYQSFRDSANQFSGITKRKHDLRGMSPIEQAIELGGGDSSRNWTMSFIRECKMRDIEFVQTWDLQETIDFLIQCDEGYDETPKLRIIPKRDHDIPLELNMLVLVPRIGAINAQKLMDRHKSLPQLIKDLQKMKKEDMNNMYKELYKVFINGKL